MAMIENLLLSCRPIEAVKSNRAVVRPVNCHFRSVQNLFKILGCKGAPKMNFMELYFVGAFKLTLHRYIWELGALG